MDPLSLIVSALAAGALAGVTDTVAGAVKDAYATVKRLLREKYSRVSVSGLEDNPKSEVQQAAVKESLQATDAAADAHLLQAAKDLLAAVAAHAPDAAKAVGVDLKRLDIDNIDIHDIKATGEAIGVQAHDVTAKSMKISGIDVNATSGSDFPR
jgi:hypothetical protein